MITEFRQDIISGDWVLISSERGKRPRKIARAEKTIKKFPKGPFEDPEKAGNVVVKKYSLPNSANDWDVVVIKNKYPAVREGMCGPLRSYGPFNIYDGVGFHEVVITRDHEKTFTEFSESETKLLFSVYRDRYRSIAREECGQYIAIFHNSGEEAGASIAHPHSQIISVPILPPDIMRSIRGSDEYYRKNRKKAHKEILSWEQEEKKRIVAENEHFVALCPFVSKNPYEVRIFPRTSDPYFEEITDEKLSALAEIFNTIMRKISRALASPPYNFFIHTAPVRKKDDRERYNFYHWHIEILPKLSHLAGFEVSTGVIINVIDPNMAADELRRA